MFATLRDSNGLLNGAILQNRVILQRLPVLILVLHLNAQCLPHLSYTISNQEVIHLAQYILSCPMIHSVHQAHPVQVKATALDCSDSISILRITFREIISSQTTVYRLLAFQAIYLITTKICLVTHRYWNSSFSKLNFCSLSALLSGSGRL